MPSLQEWKDVLEKHEFRCSLEYVDDIGPQVVRASLPPYDATSLDPRDPDDEAAVFIGKITAKVFGEWAYYSPDYRETDSPTSRFVDMGPVGWVMLAPASDPEMPMLFEILGFGPTKLDALYDALARKEPQP